MDPSITSAEITEVESLRRQASYWRTGGTVILVVFALGSIFLLNRAVHTLSDAGPGQEQFVSLMQANMKSSVAPQLEALARGTLTSMQPSISRELTNLNKRVPDIASATMKELDVLQNEMADRGTTIFEKQLDSALNTREAKIRSMFPEVQDGQLQELMVQLKEDGHREIVSVDHDLLAPHQAKIKSIMAGMKKIEALEGPNLKNVDPSWEMGLALLAVMHDDLSSLRPDAAAVNPVLPTPL